MRLSDSFRGELKLITSNLLEASSGKKLKTILITSSRRGEGKTTFSLSMAKKLATVDHLKVLLIDANIHSPLLHRIFGLPLGPGILDVINHQLPVQKVIRETNINGLSLMTLGKHEVNTSKHLLDSHFKALFTDLAGDYDYIIADGSAVLGAPETIMICSIFEAILLVVECELTKAPVVASAKDKIKAANGNLLGAVLNRRKFYIPNKFYGQ